jgi:DNA-binding beta-propeller fold protein YncE
MRQKVVTMVKRLLCAGFLFGLLASADGPGFHVIKRLQVGGEGGWDYLTVDSASRRLYVSHGNKVIVVDVDAGKVVGEIPDTPGVHGIALAPELNRGFISNGRSDDATIFDLKTLAVVGKVKTGQNPDAIQYDGVSGRVFTFNGRSKDATAFDAKSGAVQAAIPLGGKPEFSAADGQGRIYANIEDTSEIVEIDARKLAVTKRYSLSPCEEPSGLAMDRKNRRIFSVCGNKTMAVSDPDAGSVVATPPIGQGPDGAGFDAGLGFAFSSNGEGTLTVVGQTGGKWVVLETARTERGARTMTVDEKTHTVYLPTADFGPAPAPTSQNPRPRPALIPGSFRILVVGR